MLPSFIIGYIDGMNEVEYKFHALNHFPELRVSLTTLKSRQHSSFTENRSKFVQTSKQNDFEPTISHSATYLLRDLKKSCFDSIPSYLHDIRRKLRDDKKVLQSTLNNRPVTSSSFSSHPISSITPLPTNLKRFNTTNSSKSMHSNGLSSKNEAEPSFGSLERKLANKVYTFDFTANNKNYKLFQDQISIRNTLLSIDEFDVVLKRVFDIWITKPETRLLFDYLTRGIQIQTEKQMNEYDYNQYQHHHRGHQTEPIQINIPKVLAEDVIKYFRYLGNEEKQNRMFSRVTMIQRNKSIQSNQAQVQGQGDGDINLDGVVPFEEVEEKLGKAAFGFDPKKFTNLDTLKGFYTYFTAFDLKQRIERCFDIKLTESEGTAIANRFRIRDYHDQEASVDGTSFIKYFFELHAKTWRKHNEKQNILEQRQKKLRAQGQRLDYLPKLLGR